MDPPPASFGGTDAAWESDLRVRLAYSELHIRKSLKSRALFATFVTHDQRPLCAADLTRGNILRWATSLIDPARPGSRKSAQNRVSQLRLYCDYLVQAGELETNPVARLRMPSHRGRRAGAVYFTAAQVSDLIHAAEKREQRTPWRGPLSSTFYTILAITGMRYGESGRQAWSDVDLRARRLTFTADKAGRNDSLPLTREAVACLKHWRKFSTGDLVFPERPSHHTLLKDMETCKIPGTELGVRGQFHRFRKCAVRERAKAGASIRDLKNYARHADVNQTLNCYDFAEVEELRGVAEMMPRLNGFANGARNVHKKSSRAQVDSRGEPITLSTARSENPNDHTISKSEPHEDARARVIGSRSSRPKRQCSARASLQGSGREWSRGELCPRLIADILRAIAKHIEFGSRLVFLCLSIWGEPHTKDAEPDPHRAEAEQRQRDRELCHQPKEK